MSSGNSMSISLVAGAEDGGVVDELRLGVSSGTDGIEEIAEDDPEVSDAVFSMIGGGDNGGDSSEVEEAGGGGARG
jgi:hypothetical protein